MMKKKEGRGEKRTGKCMETSLFAINMKRGSLDKPKTGLCVRNDDDEVFFRRHESHGGFDASQRP